MLAVGGPNTHPCLALPGLPYISLLAVPLFRFALPRLTCFNSSPCTARLSSSFACLTQILQFHVSFVWVILFLPFFSSVSPCPELPHHAHCYTCDGSNLGPFFSSLVTTPPLLTSYLVSCLPFIYISHTHLPLYLSCCTSLSSTFPFLSPTVLSFCYILLPEEYGHRPSSSFIFLFTAPPPPL